MIKAKESIYTGLGVIRRRLSVDKAFVAALFGAIALLTALSIYRLNPPDKAAATTPLAEFSSARAMEHVRSISAAPHPLGSAGHAQVRDYICAQLLGMGLLPEVQKATAVSPRRGYNFRAGSVENILTKLAGVANSKAILLVGHYDSAPNSLGASDDGSAIATMLETLRALKAGPRLNNDLILLFTDGEEAGLLGAQAFVDEHPDARGLGLILNFEARGNSGPSIMFETSGENGWLIDEFAKAAQRPVANSLSQEIYKRLPNNTDFTVFKNAGLSGFNFAYIEGLTSYHSILDSAEYIDERSLQHHGLHALSMVRHFGNMKIENTKRDDAVYFDILGTALIHYPKSVVFGVSLFTGLVYIGVIILGFRKGLTSFSGLALGMAAFLMAAISAIILVFLLAQAVRGLPGWQSPYNNRLFISGFIAFTISIVSTVYLWFRTKAGVENLALGAWFWGGVLMILSSMYLPGGHYLLTWPLLFSLIGVGYQFTKPKQTAISMKSCIILILCAAPGIILIVPMTYQIYQAFGLSVFLAIVVVALTTLLLSLLIVQLHFIFAANKWLLPVGGTLVALCLITFALLRTGYDSARPKLSSILYGLNADSGQTIWASSDNEPDEWTSQFLSRDAQKRTLNDYLPSLGRRVYLQTRAQDQIPLLAAPEVELLEDNLGNGARALRLRITSPRRASKISIFADKEVAESWVNGKPIDVDKEVAGSLANGKPIGSRANASAAPVRNWGLDYWAPDPGGIELVLKIKTTEPVTIKVIDQSYQIPELPGVAIKARPAHIIPAPFPDNDSSMVSKSYIFTANNKGGDREALQR
jgi:hypothetical protein